MMLLGIKLIEELPDGISAQVAPLVSELCSDGSTLDAVLRPAWSNVTMALVFGEREDEIPE
jgi:hypothetical protein